MSARPDELVMPKPNGGAILSPDNTLRAYLLERRRALLYELTWIERQLGLKPCEPKLVKT